MRNKKELLELMLANQDMFNEGLCAWVFVLLQRKIIKDDESDFLQNLIKQSKPDGHCRVFYWSPEEIEPRIKWIKNQIKKEKMIRNSKIKTKIINCISVVIFVGVISGLVFYLFQIGMRNTPLITPKTEIIHSDTLNVSRATDRAKNYYQLIKDHENNN